jgi:hypothetical protein
MNDADGTSLSLAGNPARLVRKILDVRDTDRPQCKVFKLQLACYVQDAAKRLAAHGDRGPARQIAPWVLYSIAAVQRPMAAHHEFRIHAERSSRR